MPMMKISAACEPFRAALHRGASGRAGPRPLGERLPPLEREFLTMVLSEQGQAAVVKDGYIPLPAELARRAREALLL